LNEVNLLKVLVTNAEYKHSLAAVRSLGKRGIDVITISQFKHALGFYSRFSKRYYHSPSPNNEKKFIKFLKKVCKKEKIDVILPIGFDSNLTIASNIEELTQYKIPITSKENIITASDKWNIFEFAKKVSVDTPSSVKVNNPSDAKDLGLKFPVVVKGAEGSGFTSYCSRKDDLVSDVKKIRRIYEKMGTQDRNIIVQEFIKGDGYGYFALFNNGKERAYFLHKRIREFPPTGGSSAKAISVKDRRLRESGKNLLTKLKWHGVAMVEFKKDKKDGKFKLIEINPKFWGSLALAIKCGVDFPYLAAKMAFEGDVKFNNKYKSDMAYRWIFPEDTLHTLTNPRNIFGYLLDSINPLVGGDFRFTDPLPTLFQFGDTLLRIKGLGEFKERRRLKKVKGKGSAR
jgi:predicted ATP-grasp superfamily ATP-dependent carboligase